MNDAWDYSPLSSGNSSNRKSLDSFSELNYLLQLNYRPSSGQMKRLCFPEYEGTIVYGSVRSKCFLSVCTKSSWVSHLSNGGTLEFVVFEGSGVKQTEAKQCAAANALRDSSRFIFDNNCDDPPPQTNIMDEVSLTIEESLG